MNDYLTDVEVAARFGISKQQVQRRCVARQWPHLRVGQAYRFTPAHITAIEALCEVPANEKSTAQTWGRRKRGAA